MNATTETLRHGGKHGEEIDPQISQMTQIQKQKI
jgi:hypothetical protein